MGKNKNKWKQELDAEQAPEAVAEVAAEEVVAAEPVAAPVAPPAPKAEPAKMQFDGWYALRRPAIPAIHKKEILKADFKGRKVPMVATLAEFDEALKKYGVTLA